MEHSYCDYLIDLLSPWAEVTAKKMFGAWGLYHHGQIFSIVVDDTLYFKVNDSNRADYEAAGAEPFTYMARGKSVALPYWQVPGDIVDDQEALHDWAEKAYQAALTSKTKKKAKS